MTYKIYQGDCLERLKEIPDNSIDSIVTDPPYGLSNQPDMAEVLRHWLDGDDYVHKGRGFMGKEWDSFVPGPSIWRECFRVLKPGGHMVVFFGTRTYDLGVLAIRLAGFDIRDQIAWVYGSGFPKSHNIGKAIDKAAGAEREVVGKSSRCIGPSQRGDNGIGTFKESNWVDSNNITAPATDAAKQWNGWGTALKPALEPITVARKPLAKGNTVAANVLEHGTGALNVDGCRVGTRTDNESGWSKTGSKASENRSMSGANYDRDAKDEAGTGRWPANLIHDGSDEVTGLFPQTNSTRVGNPNNPHHGVNHTATSYGLGDGKTSHDYRDIGSAARFFYCSKASKKDRNDGLEDFDSKMPAASEFRPNHMEKAEKGEDGNPYGRFSPTKNIHPTVKPTDLMQYLCRLITQPSGVVLDPFMGSGSTGKAAMYEGFNFIGIDLSEEYIDIAKARIEAAKKDAYEISINEKEAKTTRKPKKQSNDDNPEDTSMIKNDLDSFFE